jgi:hypothetical protein
VTGKSLTLLLITPLVILSGCALRQPQYSPELGGFPIYRGSYSDRAQMQHEVLHREKNDAASQRSKADKRAYRLAGVRTTS